MRRHTVSCCVRAALLLAVPLVLPATSFAQQAETIEYYGTDAIGSIRIVWDGSGNVIARQDFMPFGEPVLQQGTATPKEGFGGNESDAETNQDYFHARMFEARTGRFTRTDSVIGEPTEPQTFNGYAYALNNAAAVTDEDGHFPDNIPFIPCALGLCGFSESVNVGGTPSYAAGSGDAQDMMLVTFQPQDVGGMGGMPTIPTQTGLPTLPGPVRPPTPPTVPPPPPPPTQPECDPGFIRASVQAWERSELGTANIESVFLIVRRDGHTFYPGIPNTNEVDHFTVPIINGTIGVSHTHPNNMIQLPSSGDRQTAHDNNLDVYVMSPQGLSVVTPDGQQQLLRSGLSWTKPCGS